MTDQPTPATDASLAAAEVENAPTQAATATPDPIQAPAFTIPEAAPIPVPVALTPAPVSAAGLSPSLSVAVPTGAPDATAVSSSLAKALASNDQRQVTPGNLGVPTQVANPARTTWRTFVQSLVGLLVVAVPLANAVLTQVAEYLRTQHDISVPPIAYAIVNGGIALTAFAIALVTRIMLVPGVAAFIERYVPFLAPIKASAAKH